MQLQNDLMCIQSTAVITSRGGVCPQYNDWHSASGVCRSVLVLPSSNNLAKLYVQCEGIPECTIATVTSVH